MAVIYNYDKMKELHTLMDQIIDARKFMESLYDGGRGICTKVLAAERELDDLCVRYMRLKSDLYLASA